MLKNLRISLADLLGEEYVSAVCEARAFLTGESTEDLRAAAEEKTECWPESFAARQEALMDRVGTRAVSAFADRETGAPYYSGMAFSMTER